MMLRVELQPHRKLARGYVVSLCMYLCFPLNWELYSIIVKKGGNDLNLKMAVVVMPIFPVFKHQEANKNE